MIRERLREEGRELSSRFGVRKTTIRQLSRAAGVAFGSFYLYFDSKESLYLDVLAAEIAILKAKNDQACASMPTTPDRMIGAYLFSAIGQIRESRILGLMLDWFFGHLAGILGVRARFPLCMPVLVPKLLGINLRAARIAAHWKKLGVPVAFDSACYPPFDLLSLVRSLEPFFSDLFDCPELVEQACAASVTAIAASARMPLRFSKGRRITIYPMRSSASFISPAMFERFCLPFLSALVRDFHADGIVSVLHCDGNWTPMLAHLRSLPARSCILELGEKTDMLEAKRILGDRLCIKGNIAAHTLAFSTPQDVTDQCVRLMRDVGRDGGFILSSG